MKRLSLQWRITLLTILLLAAACVTMKTLLCSSGHAYMDSIGNYVMHYAEEGPLAIRVDIPEEQWKDMSERFNGEFVVELSGAKHSFCMRGWYIALAVTALGGDAQVSFGQSGLWLTAAVWGGGTLAGIMGQGKRRRKTVPRGKRRVVDKRRKRAVT